ncbi:uncharacterized protein LOC127247751 [Andrographis paniculata]|uniref:uncharacterized protein LOC127247751 n=1 Tax=Andrographis paniculata TaxID=175694 RepID=UPI0021E89E30|nr:uncharacterized protein LOC127247751 [Andrographis paniculata]
MDLSVSNPGGGGGNNNNMVREYRKGNWTLQETMVLIEAKKMDDQRRMKRLGDSGERGKPAELRWKWVEDYCWKNGCLRSQNQCNDKWDNLMRDFKKVREYERRAVAATEEEGKSSYWRIDKNERKDNNLPSNMLPQIYQALLDVVDRKSGQGHSSSNVSPPPPPEMSAVNVLPAQAQHPMPISMLHYPVVTQPNIMRPPLTQAPGEPSVHPAPPVDSSDTSGGGGGGEYYTDSPAKRRRRRGSDGEGTSGGGDEVGSAISRSATIIAEAIQSCEEREEKRHRDLLALQQRRLHIEESKTEINRQGINGLVDAINNLANSILALANHRSHSHSHSHSPPPPP